MGVRDAVVADIEPMVRLSEEFRSRLATYSPTFWRKAEGSFEKHTAWLSMLLPLDDTIAMVYDHRNLLRGFAIARLTAAPPIFAPGGPVCLVDDFCVAQEADWPTVGLALLAAVEARAQSRGAPLSVVICAHLDARKREFLAARGFAPTSEWHVRTL